MAFSWQVVGSVPALIDLTGAVRLNDGRVFVLSGDQNAYYYNPISQTWALAGGGPSPVSRTRPGMCILSDGKVFVFGGRNLPVGLLKGDIFDPIGETWSQTTGTTAAGYLNGCRCFYFPSTNKVGIFHSNTDGRRDITLYDVAGQTFSHANYVPVAYDFRFETVQMLNGNIFICGGSPAVDTATIYDYASNTFLPVTGTMQEGRLAPTAALLDSGDIIIVGGIDETTDNARRADRFSVGTTSLAPAAVGIQRFSQFRSPYNIPYISSFSGNRAVVAVPPDIFFAVPGTIAQVYKGLTNSWSSLPLQAEIGPLVRLTTGTGHVLAISDDDNSSAEILIGDDDPPPPMPPLPPPVLIVTPNYTQAGEIVDIFGTGFSAPAQVYFGAILATQVIVHNSRHLTCRVPNGTGIVDVTVVVP